MEYYQDIYHHGILGMHWGIRRFQNSDGSLTAAGRDRYGVEGERKEGSDEESGKKGLTDKQKKYIKAGAIILGSAAVVGVSLYAAKKSGLLDKGYTALSNYAKPQNLAGDASKTFGKFKSLSKPETISEALKNTNTLNGADAQNTCVPSAIAGFLRTSFGADVKVKSTGGQMQNTAGVIEECFKGAKVLEGSATKFGRSRNDAVEMIINRFGNNCEGVCSVDLKTVGGATQGHAFSFKVVDGKCQFFDFRHGRDDNIVSKYFNSIDTNGQLVLARLDEAEPIWDALEKYMS